VAETNLTSNNEQIPSKTRKRSFTAAYKLDFIKRADACKNRGEIGALLRQESLYSSHLTKWPQQKPQGLFGSPVRGRKPKTHAGNTEYKTLEKHCQALEARLKQAEAIIEVQKKVSEIFGITPNQLPQSDKNS
jgi:transposase